MRLRVFLQGHDISDAVLVDGTTITQDSTNAISTCHISIRQAYGISRYDTAEYSHASFLYEFQIIEWEEIAVVDQDSGQTMFAGYILSVKRNVEGPHLRYDLDCSDWGILLDRAIITQSWPAGTLDAVVVTDAIRGVTGILPGTIIPQVALGAMDVKDQSVRALLDSVCQLTGGEWNIGYGGTLNYYRQGSIIAPFALSDHPNGTTSIGYQLEDYASDFTDAANRVLVLGAPTDAGEIRAVSENKASQIQYGLLSITLVNRQISDVQTAQLWADAEISTRSVAKPTVSVSLFTPGLARGMTVNVEAIKYGLAQALILRTLTFEIAAPDRTRTPVPGHTLKYKATLGFRPPDLVYAVRRLEKTPVQSPVVTATPVPPGSISAGDLAADLEVVHVVDALPIPPPADYSPTALAVIRGDPFHKLYRRVGSGWTLVVDAESIQGQLQTGQLAPGSVTSTVLADGSVVTAKIPAGAINAPQLAASSVTANAVAANAIYAEALQANSVTALALAANSVVAGKIAALAVIAGNIAADAVTAGTIAAGAVRAGSLAAGAVTAGTIASGAIRAQDAVFQTGAIQNADIQSLAGDKITAHSITSDKLSALEIAVGFGSDKPGRVGVYAQQGLFALLGDMGAAGLPAGSYWGIWARVAAFGGTGYNDSKLYTDVNGNLFLRNVSFTITSADNSTIVTSPTTFDPSYANALAMINTRPGDSSSAFVSRGLVIRNSIGTTIGALVRDPGSATVDLVMYTASGSQAVLIEGASGNTSFSGAMTNAGQIRAGSFAVIGQASFSGTVPAGRAITVNSGLVTGYV